MRPLVVLVGWSLVAPTVAVAQIEIQGFFGSALSAPIPITIAQAGQPDLHFAPHWSTRPTEPTWYYAARIGWWRGNRGWRLDHTHHKVYLDNPPAAVTDFRITNGFNIFTLSRAFRSGRLSYSVGAGPVVTFPISTVRGLTWPRTTGSRAYRLSGASMIAMVTREVPLGAGFVLSLDARTSASFARIPVATGHASVPVVAFHFHAGLGFSPHR